ncbi:MAG TPA: alginate export family protein [Acidobacteriota bacterium]|nr:alginate export family protein [Acidobacteriota bacterium]
MKKPVSLLFFFLLTGGFLFGQSEADKKGKITWGFDERIRWKAGDNFVDVDESVDDSWGLARIRTRGWLGLPISESAKFHLRMTNEFRKYFYPEGEKYDFRVNEFVFDNAYLELNPRKDLTLRIGRQDMFIGEGLVIMDGSPLDGSRTYYFNAVRATWRGAKTTVDGFAISNTARDRYLPVLNRNLTQNTVERDEQGAGIYVTRQLTNSLKGEFYDVFKREEAAGALPLSRLNTTGLRLTGSFKGGIQHAAEFAVQLGDYGANSRRGYGGYVDFRKSLPSLPRLTLQLNYTHLSGDDPDTADCEGWNPIFSRWPKWSELYIYTQVQEGRGPAYWTNIGMLSPGLNWKFSDRVNLDLVYRLMFAPEARIVAGQKLGHRRGNLMIAKLNFRVNRHFVGHLLAETLDPGDFYPDSRSFAHFLRSEFMFQF